MTNQPRVARVADGHGHGHGHGLPAMRCPICHQKANVEAGRVPGTQKQAGALVEAWVKTGAACPAK